MAIRAGGRLLGAVLVCLAFGAAAQDDARTRQLRLLCAQLSGDLTDPGGLAAFRRCLTRNPLDEIKRDNAIGGAPAADRPDATPPAGFGHYSRRLVAEGVERFQTLDGKTFFALDRDGTLWRFTVNARDGLAVARQVAAFQAMKDDVLFLLGKDGALRSQDKSSGPPIELGQNLAGFQAVDGGAVYTRGTDGRLSRRSAGVTTPLDRAVAEFQAIDGAVVYVLGADGKLWREAGDASNRAQVAADVAAFEYVADGAVAYVLTKDGALWRREGAHEPERFDSSVSAFHAVDMNLLYVLGRDGRLWRELGGRDHAELVDGPVLAGAGRAAFQATDAQHVYALGVDHKLWAETMPGGR